MIAIIIMIISLLILSVIGIILYVIFRKKSLHSDRASNIANVGFSLAFAPIITLLIGIPIWLPIITENGDTKEITITQYEIESKCNNGYSIYVDGIEVNGDKIILDSYGQYEVNDEKHEIYISSGNGRRN